MVPHPRVLLVNDAANERLLIIHPLQQTLGDLTIHEAGTAEDFTAALTARDFDVVVIDDPVGGATGIELLRAVKACLPACPVLMVSASTDLEQMIGAMREGLDDYILKGSQRYREVATAVREAYARRPTQRQTGALTAERMQLIERLAQERELLDALVGQLPVGVVVAEAPSGKIVRTNAAVGQLWSAPFPLADGVANYTIYQAWHTDGRPYKPEDWPLARALRTGELVHDEEIALVRGDGVLRTMVVSASPVRDREGRIVLGVATFADISERPHAAQVSRLLAEAGRIVATSFDYETTLDALARLAVPSLADSCVVDLIDEDGTWRAVGVANVNPEHEALIREMRRRYPPGAQVVHAGHRVAQNLTPRLVPALDDTTLAAAAVDDTHLAMLRTLRMESAVVVPLVSGQRSLGAISFGVTGARRPYNPTDLALAEELAQLAVLAIEHALLYEQAQAAQEVAQRRAARVSELQQLTAALSQALAPEDVADVIINLAVATVGAYAGSLVLPTPAGDKLTIFGARGYSAAILTPWQQIDLDARVPIADAVREGDAVYLHSREEWLERYPHLAKDQARSSSQAIAALPLRVDTQVIGALGLSFAVPQAFDEEDRSFIEALASHCAQALERAHLYGLERDAREAAEATARALAQTEAVLKARLAQQAAVAELGERALLVSDLQVLFDTASTMVAQTLAVDYAKVLELLPDGAALLLRADYGWKPGLVGQALVGVGKDSQAGYTLTVDEPVIVADLRTETRFPGPALLHDHGVVSGVSVIIRTASSPFGVFGAHSVQPRQFTQDDVHFVQSMANVLGAAIDRVRAEAERHTFERQLQETQKLESLGVLAGGIAHDFNNLLAVIIGNAHLALTELVPEAPARTTVRNIEQAAQRAAELTRQMLAYAGRGRLVVEPINLTTLIEETHHLLQASISKRAVLRYHLTSDPPNIEADPTQLRQVVMNLVVNASEAIGEKSGIITIATGAMWADEAYLAELDASFLTPGQYVMLEVSDTGVGMDTTTQARIFEPFFTTKFTGRGLGLAAVQGIVRRHRGALKVYSELGRGSTFKLIFPSLEGPALPRQQTQVAAAANWSGLVLVVEDEAEVRALLERLLERMGFAVVSAADGRTGVETFRAYAKEIRCVFLDMMMPHMNGEEAFRELKRIDPEVRVIAMSGYTEEEITSRFAGKGLAGFLSKPFTPDLLRAQIETVLLRKGT